MRRTDPIARRATAAAVLTLVLTVGAPVSRASAEPVQAALDRMMGALGGREAIAGLHSLAVEAECTGPGGPFRTRVDSLRPGAVFFHQLAGDGTTAIWSTPSGG